MKKNYSLDNYHPFVQDESRLLEMLTLRRAGWSFVALAERYHCDRTSLRYHCRKYQIFPVKTKFVKYSREVFSPHKMVGQMLAIVAPALVKNWKIIDGERVNAGKSYAEYLKANSPYKERP